MSVRALKVAGMDDTLEGVDDVGGSPLRQGDIWTEHEYEQLIEWLGDGVTVAQIAQQLQRTPGAIHAQIKDLIPRDADVAMRGNAGRESWLREQLANDPHYDWRTVLRSRTDRRFWSADDDQVVRLGWSDGTLLRQIAVRLDASESQVVQRIIDLGLAVDVADIVDRLGATPGGCVEARARLLRAELAEAVYVLHRPWLQLAAERGHGISQGRTRLGKPVENFIHRQRRTFTRPRNFIQDT
ncbi:hypothetical protein [Pilimelia columellifera]|uniref:Uncharacterized protein n=1 Tax=Pilimelia columellifera subsp. columellifera TaxID=706583 RepID=A0ABP6B5L5_9ACTN